MFSTDAEELALDFDRTPPSASIQMYSAMIFPFCSRAKKGASCERC